MKALGFFLSVLVLLAITGEVGGQTVLFSENFETASLPDSVNHVGNGQWGKSSTLFSQGSRSDSLRILGTGDSVAVTTYSFSTTGNSNVMLHFDHICKIEFYDEAYIEVSGNNGATWTRLLGIHYLGLSQFATQANKFTSAAYGIDWAPGTQAVPTNAWWRSEIFDISGIAGNASQVLVRFVLKDASLGSILPDNYAWFIDNIRVIGAFSELIPPTITLLSTMQDTLYGTAPVAVSALITDASGIDTTFVVYTVNNGPADTIGMTLTGVDTYTANLPFPGFGRTVCFRIVAIDGSAAANKGTFPTNGCSSYFHKYNTASMATVGTGTTASTLYTFYASTQDVRTQHLYLASELMAGGAVSGGNITSIAVNFSATSATTFNGLTIAIKPTAATTISALETSGFTTVYTANFTPSATGWVTFNFQTPFAWDGVSNLIVNFCHDNSATGTSASLFYTSTSGRFVYATNSTAGISGCNLTGGTASTYRLNMRFNIAGAAAVATDAGIGQLVNPTGSVVASTTFNVVARVRNFGTDTLQTATIGWSIDGVVQTPIPFTGPLHPDSLSVPITLGSLNLPLGVHVLKVWTSNPNGLPDMNYGNDTITHNFMACANVLAGTYTIGGTNSDFVSFNDALLALHQCGIMAPVTFNVAPGTYTEQLTIGQIAGASSTSLVTFKSATNDSNDVILQFTSTAAASNYVINFHNTGHIAFNHMTLKALNATNARVILFSGNISNVTLQGNVMEGTQTVNTDDNQFVIHNIAGGTFNGINLLGNRILNGRFAINFASSANPMTNVVIKHNHLLNQLQRPMNLNGSVALDFGYNTLFSDATKTTNAGIFTTNLTGEWRFYNNTLINMAGVRVWEGWTYGGDAIGQEALVYNNYFYGSSATSYVFDGGGAVNHIKFYHNTFVGNSTTRTVNFNNFYGANINITFVNNIIQSTGQLLYFTANPTGLVIDYNNYFTTSTGNWAYFWGANATNLASIKTASGQNANSAAINPMFASTTDPHFTNFALKGLGTPVSQVTTDIDGQPRSTTAPDMGCDEFILYTDDAGIMAMIPATLCPGTANVSARLKNFGSNILQSVTIHWSVDGVAQTPYNYVGSLASLGEVNIGVGIYNLLSSGTYALKFWTSLPNGNPDGNNGNDTLTINNFKTSFSGNYTIGGIGADFNTPAEAVAALNTYGVCGPTVFDIHPGTYPGRLTINIISGASEVNTITFRSLNNDTAVVITDSATSTANNWVVRMNGARYVTFKSITFAPKHMTFSNAMVFINSAQYNTVEGCLFLGVGSGSTVDLALLRNEDFNSKGNKILGNRFFKGSVGILMKGGSASTVLDSVYIYGNVIQQFSQRGIRVEYANSPIIDSNVIVSSSAVTEMHGVSLSYCYDAYQITRNSIYLSNFSNLRGADLGNITSTSTTWGLIANNFITLIGTASSTNCYGIRLYPNVFYTRVAHNSLLVNTGNQHNDTRGINATTQCTNIEVINNNVVSNNFPCFYEGSSVTYSDYNNFFSTANRYAYHTTTTFTYTSLAALVAAMQKDSNSISVNPYFASITDLHTNLGALNGVAKPLSYVTIDIDGDPRHPTHPDIGADEFVPSPFDLEANSMLNPPLTGCGYTTQEDITLKIRNVGSSDVNGGFTASYQINNGTIITETITDTIVAGGFLDYSFSSKADLSVGAATNDQVMQLKAWISFTLDTFNPNDTTAKTIVSGYRPAPPTPPAPYNSIYATTTSITATSPEILIWYATTASVTPIFVGTLFTTPQLYDTTTFYVGARSSQGLQCVSALVPVTVNITGYPQQDAGITSIVNPAGNIPSGVNHALKVTLKNYGVADLTSVMIPYSINGITQDTLIWSGILPHGATQLVDVDSFNLQGGLVTMKAWTTMPNNTADIYNNNDTASVSFSACMQGTFTIGQTPGMTYDFPSFTAARNALIAAGVCGNVTFLVDTGVYVERMFWNAVPGAGPNARITFQSMSGDSTSVTLRFTLSSAAAWAMKFIGGASYFTFKQLTLSVSGSASFGRIMEFDGGASHIHFENCILEGVTNATASTNFALIFSNTGQNNHNKFIHCNILQGAYFAYVYGSSTVKPKGWVFMNNKITGFTQYGIFLYYNDSAIVVNNFLTSLSSATTGYGIYASYCGPETNLSKNTIIGNNTGTFYGIYANYCSGTAAERVLISNNMISVLGNLTSITGHGIYLNYNNNIDVFFNSVRILGTTSTSGRAMTYFGGSSADIRNNNFIMNSMGHAAYYGNITGIINMNHNNYWAAGTNYVYYNGANRTDLAALKSVSGMEAMGQSINPPFISNTDLRLLSTVLSIKGQYIAKIPDDIDGETRGPIPTIGADEVALLGVDAGISMVIVPGTQHNEFDVITPVVILCNYGTDTLFSVPIEYKVNNGTPVTFTYNGVLAQYGCDTVTLPTFVCPAGNATFCAKTMIQGDTNTFNDEACKSFFGKPQYDAQLVRIKPLAEGCGLGMDTVRIVIRNLGVMAINGNISASYQVNGVSTVVTQAVSTSIPANDSIQFTFSTLVNLAVTTADSIFNIKAWVNLTGDNVSGNDTSTTSVKSFFSPAAPVPVHATVPYASPANVTANAQPNATLIWWDAPTGGNKLHEGTTYNTGLMYTNDTLWVEASGGNQGASVTLGTGTATNTTTGFPTPYANYFWGNKEQYLITAAELMAMGGAAAPITRLAFEVANVNACPGLSNFYIQIAHTTTSVMTGWVTGNFTQVYSVTSYQPFNGWNNHIFQTPFVWDGVQNIVIEVCFNNSAWVSNGNASVYYSTTASNSVARYNGDNANVCNAPASVTATANRPNLKLELEPTGCTSIRVPLYITVSAPAAADAGVSAILQPFTAVNLGSQETVQVKVKNYGTAAQSNIPVSFRIDNQAAVTETITATIPNGDSLVYTFVAKANLGIVGNTFQLKAWTSLTGDNTHLNDTAYKTVLNLLPNYCISTATSPAYEELTNVTLHTLNNTSVAANAMYTDFTATVPPPVLSPGMNYPISISSSASPGYTGSYTCNVKVWIDYNRDGTFDPVSELAYQSVTSSTNTVTGTVTIPVTALSGNTRMRVVFQETSNAALVNPCGTYSWGETEDYLVMIAPQSNCDAGVIAILQPVGLQTAGATLPVYVKFMNFGSDTIQANALALSYVFNNGTPVVTNYTNALAPMAQDSIFLPNITLNLGNNTLCVTTVLACDSVQFNNEQCINVFGQFQTAVPYFDDFETNNYWYKPATSTNWQLGTPNANVINSAYSGTKAWVTNLTGDYSNNANDYLYSPQFNFSALGSTDTITLSFYHWADMAASDYGRIQYSKDGGNNWSNLGFMNDPLGTNWYNAQAGGSHYFSLTNTGWQLSAYKLDPYTFNTPDTIQFRFHFSSNASGTANGWAIDNFRLALPQVPNDIGISSINFPVIDTAIGSTIHATVTITNYGTATQVMFPVVLKINGNVVATEIWTGVLASQANAQYTFITPFTVPIAAYQLCAETQLAGDAFPVNNWKCLQLGVTPALNDVGITAILEPLPDASGNICFHNTSFPWAYFYETKVRIKNFGQNTQSSIPVSYSFFNGGQVYVDTWTGSLLPNDSVVFVLSESYKPKLGAQQVCVETTLPNDLLAGNNKVCRSYIGIVCPIGIDDQQAGGLILHQNIPNPAAGTTSIRFEIPGDGNVSLGIVNLIGQTVFLTEQTFSAGEHKIDLDVTPLAAGVYQYFVEFNGYRLTRKMVVSR
jgi:hypothetical protein